MKELLFIAAMYVALEATARAIWAVGFSRMWKEEAKQFLDDKFGAGPNDDYLVEIARQNSARCWLGVAAVAWGVVSLTYKQIGGVT